MSQGTGRIPPCDYGRGSSGTICDPVGQKFYSTGTPTPVNRCETCRVNCEALNASTARPARAYETKRTDHPRLRCIYEAGGVRQVNSAHTSLIQPAAANQYELSSFGSEITALVSTRLTPPCTPLDQRTGPRSIIYPGIQPMRLAARSPRGGGRSPNQKFRHLTPTQRTGQTVLRRPGGGTPRNRSGRAT